MNALYEKSIRTLELGRVLEMLAGYAVSDDAKEECLNIEPSSEQAEVRRRQGETTAARSFMAARNAPSFLGVRDVRPSVKRAELGGLLNTRELLDIAFLLGAARNTKAHLGREEKTPIDHLFQGLHENKFLEEKITGIILEENQIADSASPELYNIRRLMRAANSRVRESLQKIISSPAYSKALQEPIITLRGDRYVIPVKSEYKNEIGGLVHDVSSSGATFFIEPTQVVQANNELRELSSKEGREIERILYELSADAAGYAREVERDYEILVALDVIFAKAKLSSSLGAVEPEICGEGRIDLVKVRHPLLEQGSAVPVDIRLGGEFDTLVITGPNTGGKTVALKSIGLMVLMAECGLHIPAGEGSRLAVFDAVYADIGDEQSIEQSLSTFSSHMTNIVGILGDVDSASLALFDELGAGTDPVEGAALAVAVIQYVRSFGARVAATTHYAELKTFAMTTPGVENASCEFDVETLRPTYRLLIGIPGRSNAFAISARLGLPEHVITQAKALVSSENVQFEDVLAQLERKRQIVEQEHAAVRELRRETEALRHKASERENESNRERESASAKARAEAGRIIEDARRAVDSVYAELDDIRRRAASEEEERDLGEARADLKRTLNEADKNRGGGLTVVKREEEPSRPIRAGDTVEILSIGTKASVITPPDREGNLLLQAGIMKVTVREDEVRLTEDKTTLPVPEKPAVDRGEPSARSTGMELDLRGMTSDEAVAALDGFIDGCVLAHLNTVSIIHGKGTGVLRAAVQLRLKQHHRVKSFRLGRYGEGEAGVTIAELL